jgi:hypothetical protein
MGEYAVSPVNPGMRVGGVGVDGMGVAFGGEDLVDGDEAEAEAALAGGGLVEAVAVAVAVAFVPPFFPVGWSFLPPPPTPFAPTSPVMVARISLSSLSGVISA